ncbi:hypothetical protein RFI_27934, partial [Reticulomyxa filosa]
MLILFNGYLIVEAFVINPILYIVRRGRILEFTESSEMHSFLRLKAVAELFVQSIPQLFMQLYIYFNGAGVNLGLTFRSIASAIASAVLNIVFITFILNKEAMDNEQSFFDYAILTLQKQQHTFFLFFIKKKKKRERFGYTPFVDSIAKGRTRYVDYMAFNQGQLRFNADAIRKLIGALNSKHAQVGIIRMGNTCVDLGRNADDMLILWRLRDMCSRKFIQFQEDLTD